MGVSATFLADLGKELATQDGLATSHPIFVVQQRRRLYGFDLAYADHHVWVDLANDSVEATPRKAAALDARYRSNGMEPDGWTRTAYQDIWEFVTACLTRKGAEAYISRNGHNLTAPRVYVESGYRNEEWIELRRVLADMVTKDAGSQPD